MNNIVEFSLKDGTKFYAEASTNTIARPQTSPVSEGENPFLQVGRGVNGITETAVETFEQAINALQPTTTAILESLRSLSPDACEIEFGLKVSVGAFVFISAGGDANFKVTMTWNKVQK